MKNHEPNRVNDAREMDLEELGRVKGGFMHSLDKLGILPDGVDFTGTTAGDLGSFAGTTADDLGD